MTATAEVATKITVTPTTGTIVERTLSFTSATAPAEVLANRVVTGSSAFTLDLGDIAVGSGYILWLYAITGNFYFILGATSGTPSATNSHLQVKEGEAYPVPINPNATMMTGIRGLSSSATGQLEYLLVGA